MLTPVLLLAQEMAHESPDAEAAAAAAAFFFMFFVCWLVFMALALVAMVAIIAGLWKIFEKAGKPGWAAIIPIYNLYILHEIAQTDIIWFILCLIPIANIVGAFMIWIEVAKRFGKDVPYAIGLVLLPVVFVPMLGFGKSQYMPVKNPPPYPQFGG